MNGAFLAKDVLRARDAHVVDGLRAKMRKPRPKRRKRCKRQRCASRASMKIDTKIRPKAGGSSGAWRKRPVDVGIAFEDCAKTVLDDDRQLNIGPAGFEQTKRGRRQDAIAERA
jgi:hypothetical protein